MLCPAQILAQRRPSSNRRIAKPCPLKTTSPNAVPLPSLHVAPHFSAAAFPFAVAAASAFAMAFAFAVAVALAFAFVAAAFQAGGLPYGCAFQGVGACSSDLRCFTRAKRFLTLIAHFSIFHGSALTIARTMVFPSGFETILRVTFSLRPYAPADFETLYEIDQLCYPPEIAYSRRELRNYLRFPGADCVVAEAVPENIAESGPVIIGFCITAHLRAEGYIITMDVLAAHRRQGVATALLAEAERRLAENGVSEVGLETATDNDSAIAFWQKHGYRKLRRPKTLLSRRPRRIFDVQNSLNA